MMQTNQMMGNAMMQGQGMMHGCPTMGGGGTVMMIGMGLIWLLTIVLLVLGIAALLKYLRSGRNN